MLCYPRSCRWGTGWVMVMVMLRILMVPLSGPTRHISAAQRTDVVLWFCFSLGLQSPNPCGESEPSAQPCWGRTHTGCGLCPNAPQPSATNPFPALCSALWARGKLF